MAPHLSLFIAMTLAMTTATLSGCAAAEAEAGNSCIIVLFVDEGGQKVKAKRDVKNKDLKEDEAIAVGLPPVAEVIEVAILDGTCEERGHEVGHE